LGARDFGKIINLTTAESTVSDYVDTKQVTGISIHIVNGPITGTLYLEASDNNAIKGVVVTEVVFDDLVGTADDQIMNITNCNSRYYRVGYNHTSGTGKLIVYMTVKAGDR
jgi:hypothetical protein